MQYPCSCPASHPCSWQRHVFSAGSSSSREHASWVRHSSWNLPGTLYNNVEKRKCVWSGLTWKARLLSTEMERGAPMPRWKLLIRPLILTTTFGSSAVLGCVWRNSFQGEKWKPWHLSLWLPDNCPLFPDIHPSLLLLALRLLLTGTLGWWKYLWGGSCFSGSEGSGKTDATWIVPGSVPTRTAAKVPTQLQPTPVFLFIPQNSRFSRKTS